MTKNEQVAVEQIDHGTYEDAVAFALDAHDDTLQTYEFLKAWRNGDLDEWPEYYEWLSKRTRALEASQAQEAGDGEKLRNMLQTLSDCADEINGQIDRETETERRELGPEWPVTQEFYVTLQWHQIKALNDAICQSQELLRTSATPTRIEAAQTQEVVAWLYTHWAHPKDRPPAALCFQREERIGEGWTETPLYALTPPQAAESGLLDEALELLSKLANAADGCDPRYEDDEDQVQDRVNEALDFLAKAGKAQS